MPHELALVGIYFSPLLPIVLFGILGALATAFVLNRTGLSGWFANPPWVIYGVDRHLCVSPPTVRWFYEHQQFASLVPDAADHRDCLRFLLHPLQRLFQESLDA